MIRQRHERQSGTFTETFARKRIGSGACSLPPRSPAGSASSRGGRTLVALEEPDHGIRAKCSRQMLAPMCSRQCARMELMSNSASIMEQMHVHFRIRRTGMGSAKRRIVQAERYDIGNIANL
jgi:hypothetical protein